MASLRHRLAVAQAAKRRIRQGRMWYQRKRRRFRWVQFDLSAEVDTFIESLDQLSGLDTPQEHRRRFMQQRHDDVIDSLRYSIEGIRWMDSVRRGSA